jgi:hypothetical protein
VRLSIAFLLLAACDADPLGMVPDSGTPRDTGPVDAVAIDSGSEPTDAAPLDAEPMDSSAPDTMTPDSMTPDAGETCDFTVLGAADRDRVLLVGQPFTAQPGVDGTEIRSLSLSAAGVLTDVAQRLDVGFRPNRIEFTPDGTFAIVLGEDGDVASVRVVDAQTMMMIDAVALPAAGYGDLRVWQDGRTWFVVGSNVDTSSGISTVDLACDGSLTVRTNEFFNVRLSDSLAFLPDPTRAILLGGQAVFDPVDPDDVRLVEYTPGTGWSLIESFDIYADHIDALRIAVSPDGSTLLIPNGSAFSNDGNQLSVVDISGATLSETGRLMNLEDAREALFSTDGRTALVTLLTPGRIAVLADQGGGFTEVDRLTGIGLAENMAALVRGQLQDYVFVTSVDASGEPNVAIVRITGAGAATVVDMTNLGADSENIPVGIAVQP